MAWLYVPAEEDSDSWETESCLSRQRRHFTRLVEGQGYE
jgi:hypothetical protein